MKSASAEIQSTAEDAFHVGGKQADILLRVSMDDFWSGLMRLLRGVLTNESFESPGDHGLDFAIHTNSDADVTTPGNVRTYCTEKRCEGMTPVMTSPFLLADQIRTTLRPGVRAMLGNAGCELTFRHISAQPDDNVLHILRWAHETFQLVGSRLVLAPMDFDLIHDVMTGGRLLTWAAERRVPLAVFCGYRFLFPEDAFAHIREVCARIPLRGWGNPYCYPYLQVSEAIRRSGAKIWTGAGYDDGLTAGILERAEEFGFAAVFTTQDAWNRWNQTNQP